MTQIKLSCIRTMVLVFCVFIIGCSAQPILENNAVSPRVTLADKHQKITLLSAYQDPFEGFNRRMYYFNALADEYFLLPVVKGYKTITPDIVESGVSNFFSNIGEVSTFINALLQFKFAVAGETIARFTFNSTVGVAGLFDVATPIGFYQQDEDFGQTLGFWGVDAGPYLVLPFIGPSSVRDFSGLAIDMFAEQEFVSRLDFKADEELILSLIQGIDARASMPFRYYASGSAFEYDNVKLLFMKYRELQIAR